MSVRLAPALGEETDGSPSSRPSRARSRAREAAAAAVALAVGRRFRAEAVLERED
jgi:hypothetical protein